MNNTEKAISAVRRIDQEPRSRDENPDRRIVMNSCGINGRGEWI